MYQVLNNMAAIKHIMPKFVSQTHSKNMSYPRNKNHTSFIKIADGSSMNVT